MSQLSRSLGPQRVKQAIVRPPRHLFTSRPVGVQQSRLRAWFNKLRPSSEDAGVYGSQTRDDFGPDDVEQYFNYMGMLATEGTYDKLHAIVKSGLHPVDILLVWACQENDDPKVQELLNAGADFTVKNLEGKTPLSLTTSEEVKELLVAAGAKE